MSFISALFTTNLLSDADREALLNAHFYLIKISQVDEREVFKICLEYWLILLVGLYEEVSRLPIGADFTALKLRKDIYKDVLTNLRLVGVGKMVKPEEVGMSVGRPICPDISSILRFLLSKMKKARWSVNICKRRTRSCSTR